MYRTKNKISYLFAFLYPSAASPFPFFPASRGNAKGVQKLTAGNQTLISAHVYPFLPISKGDVRGGSYAERGLDKPDEYKIGNFDHRSTHLKFWMTLQKTCSLKLYQLITLLLQACRIIVIADKPTFTGSASSSRFKPRAAIRLSPHISKTTLASCLFVAPSIKAMLGLGTAESLYRSKPDGPGLLHWPCYEPC